VPARVIIGILIVKAAIWSVALGSGTSGGVLAPLLMMGGALGGVEAWLLPDLGAGFWPLVSMGAILGGTMRAPLTGVIFALELTHDINMLLPLLIAVSMAHAFTVLVLKRSILTEKIARRGYHLSREYAIDPLEILFVREVMRTAADERTRPEARHGAAPAVAYPDEPLRIVVHRMADTGHTRFHVVERGPAGRLLGTISLEDLLKARSHNLEAERRRERTMTLWLPFAMRQKRRQEE
jgi:chloride channel protein, CIC family